MRFQVTGVDQKTGAGRILAVEALDDRAAGWAAIGSGIDVLSITPVAGQGQTPWATPAAASAWIIPDGLDRLVIDRAVRYGRELGVAYFLAVPLGITAAWLDPWLAGEEALRIAVPQGGLYLLLGTLCFVFASAGAAAKRWGMVGLLTTASLCTLQFVAAAVVDLLLLPYALSHLILSGIFLTLAAAAGVKAAQSVGVLSRAAARSLGGFEIVAADPPPAHRPPPAQRDNLAA